MVREVDLANFGSDFSLRVNQDIARPIVDDNSAQICQLWNENQTLVVFMHRTVCIYFEIDSGVDGPVLIDHNGGDCFVRWSSFKLWL